MIGFHILRFNKGVVVVEKFILSVLDMVKAMEECALGSWVVVLGVARWAIRLPIVLVFVVRARIFVPMVRMLKLVKGQKGFHKVVFPVTKDYILFKVGKRWIR